jgi:hypothetical protein
MRKNPPRPRASKAIITSIKQRLGPIVARHRFDGITTCHNDSFRETKEFQNAYARAVRAAGWDYGIPYRIHQALWCAKIALKVPGAFVELGTGRGFVMSSVMTLGIGRQVHLFDTFRPSLAGGDPSPHYAVDFDSVAANFAEWPNVTLHPGDLRTTLSTVSLESVAFLHVDMNNAEPEVFGVRRLWPLMPRGAVMLLDDFAYVGFEPQHEAISALADEFGFDVLSTPTGQGIVIK